MKTTSKGDTKRFSKNEIWQAVNLFQSKSDNGLNQDEIEIVLKDYNINREKFDDAIIGNDCLIEDGKIVYMYDDIVYAINIALVKEKQQTFNWD